MSNITVYLITKEYKKKYASRQWNNLKTKHKILKLYAIVNVKNSIVVI